MLSTARVRRPAFAAALMLSLVSGVALVHGSAAAAASCTFDVDAKTVTVSSSENLTIDRTDTGAIVISRRRGGPAVVLPCGDPTVTTVDRIDIVVTGEMHNLRIDQRNGRFAPGSATATASEISFQVSYDSASAGSAALTVIGTAAADAVTVGYSGINLDSAEDAVADITYPDRPGRVRIEGRGGADVLSGAGGDGTGVVHGSGLATMMLLVGGRDDDRIVGGTNTFAYAVYDDAPHGVSIDLAAGTAAARAGATPDAVGADAVQTASVVGTNFADVVAGTTGTNYIDGLEGVDVVRGRGGSDDMTVRNSLSVVDYADVAGPLMAEPSGHHDPATGYFVFGEASYPGGHDWLRGFGGIRGTPENDTFTYWAAGIGLGGIDGRGGADLITYANMPPAYPLHIDLGRGCVGAGASDDCQRLRRVERVVGGPGADVIVGNSAVNVLSGGGGNDRIYGRAGNDKLSGGAGNDLLRPGLGADGISGGPGFDTVDYRERSATVRVSLNAYANDGEAGERDYVRPDVENIFGGSSNDVLAGNGYRNVLNGGAGNDRLYGYGGNDRLIGGVGADHLSAGAGNDVLYARDRVRDSVIGGLGTDTAYVDRIDNRSGVERLR